MRIKNLRGEGGWSGRFDLKKLDSLTLETSKTTPSAIFCATGVLGLKYWFIIKVIWFIRFCGDRVISLNHGRAVVPRKYRDPGLGVPSRPLPIPALNRWNAALVTSKSDTYSSKVQQFSKNKIKTIFRMIMSCEIFRFFNFRRSKIEMCGFFRDEKEAAN